MKVENPKVRAYEDFFRLLHGFKQDDRDEGVMKRVFEGHLGPKTMRDRVLKGGINGRMFVEHGEHGDDAVSLYTVEGIFPISQLSDCAYKSYIEAQYGKEGTVVVLKYLASNPASHPYNEGMSANRATFSLDERLGDKEFKDSFSRRVKKRFDNLKNYLGL